MTKPWEVVINGKRYTARWYFQQIMYEGMLNGETEVVLSTIDAYKDTTQKTITDLMMYGWCMKEMEENPYKRVQQGTDRMLTIYKYHLVLHEYIQSIQNEVLTDKLRKDILVGQLNNITKDRSDTEKIAEEIMSDETTRSAIIKVIQMVQKHGTELAKSESR